MKYLDLFDEKGDPKNYPFATFFTFSREADTLCMAISGRKYITVASDSPNRVRGTIGSAGYQMRVVEQFPHIQWASEPEKGNV